MSPQIEDLTVRIKADTSAFDRALQRVRWSLWLWQWGLWAVIAGTFFIGLAVGIAAGVLGS